ncbi:NAD-dependent epimerase/dehydratase family protein [Acanthopleuribacter pedis]|uniref:NAD(P)H-binding protein n=1 Tax=Acanthopleuribacter pedis TaxID=442870 RepID=A0A8J7QQS0_9BACT|nr:NAD-dependent epimerase/dehydratase family protein [Acanthopleuribacter pedis]MBO1323135.1 NAD(P)H-binding protein [Acanthopleuribacter pedis]
MTASEQRPWPDGSPQQPITVAIAGATGLIGTHVRNLLEQDPRFRVVVLTRSPARAGSSEAFDGRARWRHCDLFSLHITEEALAGVDVAVYLAHSMLPSSRLTQARFVDLDLILVDNFAHAAASAGVRQIVHISSLIPAGDTHGSAYLEHKIEEEQTMASCSVPVTTLRAGLILGPGGSTARFLVNLVRRLPLQLLPAWCQAPTRPIAAVDVARAVVAVSAEPAYLGQTYELGGPDTMTFAEMLERAASVLYKRRVFLKLPGRWSRLSRLCLTLFGSASKALAGMVVDSHERAVVPQPNPVLDVIMPDAVPFETMLRESIQHDGRAMPNPRQPLRQAEAALLKARSEVRSVQRLRLPPGRDAVWVAHQYMRWLPRFGFPFIKADIGPDRHVQIRVRGINVTLLELSFSPGHSTPNRQIFHITGGVLVRPNTDGWLGRLELREILDQRYVLTGIHNFRPAMPWYLYNLTQAQAHLFAIHLLDLFLQRAYAQEKRRTAG